MLKEMGYKDVRSLAGGFKAWVELGYEIESDSLLTKEQLNHYSRQIIHAYDNVGKRKVASALEALKRANPMINLIGIDERITPGNVLDIMNGFDIVLDGSDNFATKYLLNDACFFAGKPYIFGGATRFEGQASVFHPAGGGPCLRCIWPTPPMDGLVPT
jgi:adenylyltransferase/sulfurtransferase